MDDSWHDVTFQMAVSTLFSGDHLTEPTRTVRILTYGYGKTSILLTLFVQEGLSVMPLFKPLALWLFISSRGHRCHFFWRICSDTRN